MTLADVKARIEYLAWDLALACNVREDDDKKGTVIVSFRWMVPAGSPACIQNKWQETLAFDLATLNTDKLRTFVADAAWKHHNHNGYKRGM